MIVIRANHDISTFYLYSYSKELIEEAKNRGFKVAEIEGEEISELIIRSRIRKRKPKFIFFSGHGNDSSIFDNEGKVFIDINSVDVFKETITYTIACSCLNHLGSTAIRKGCHAFIGYNKPFWIARDQRYASRPLEDEAVRPIIECSNIVVRSLLKGNNVEESIKKSHEKAVDNILKLIFSKEPLATAALYSLINNDEALSFKGDGAATII